jgi:hypothetical protein
VRCPSADTFKRETALPLTRIPCGNQNQDTSFSRGTATGPSGILAVRGVSGLATGLGARRLGASFAGTCVMVTTADFFCSAHRSRWAAAIRSRASAGSARLRDFSGFRDFRASELEAPAPLGVFGVTDCSIRVRASRRRAISASRAAMICSVSTHYQHTIGQLPADGSDHAAGRVHSRESESAQFRMRF